MANGDWVALNKDWAQVKLLDAEAGAAADGVWIDVQRYGMALVDFTFSATGTTELRASSAATKPANNTHGVLLVTAVTNATTPPVVTIAVTPRWLKARTTASTGTISVSVTLRTNGG